MKTKRYLKDIIEHNLFALELDGLNYIVNEYDTALLNNDKVAYPMARISLNAYCMAIYDLSNGTRLYKLVDIVLKTVRKNDEVFN